LIDLVNVSYTLDTLQLGLIRILFTREKHAVQCSYICLAPGNYIFQNNVLILITEQAKM